MMPENAGGMQQAMTSMDRLSVSIPQSAPAMQMASGERKSLKTVFQIISALMPNGTVASARPAAKTATPELAFAMSSNEG